MTHGFKKGFVLGFLLGFLVALLVLITAITSCSPAPNAPPPAPFDLEDRSRDSCRPPDCWSIPEPPRSPGPSL